jgi:hypothetical protein
VVDTNTNIARLLAAPPTAQLTGTRPRVEGLLVPRPQDQTGGAGGKPGATPAPAPRSGTRP